MRSLTGRECKNRSDSAVCVRSLRWVLLAETGDCIWQPKHKQQACDDFKGFWESMVVSAKRPRDSFYNADHSCRVSHQSRRVALSRPKIEANLIRDEKCLHTFETIHVISPLMARLYYSITIHLTDSVSPI